MTSVARKSHIATLPGVTSGCWTPVVAAGVTWSASAVSVGTVAYSIGEVHPSGHGDTAGGPVESKSGQAGIGFTSKSIRIAGRYTNEARSRCRAVWSLTSDQNRTAYNK